MIELSCDKCKYKNCGEDDEPCVNCSNNYTSEYKTMTNADKINAMSIEEKTEFLSSDQCCMMSETWDRKSIYEWLQSEVKESE